MAATHSPTPASVASAKKQGAEIITGAQAIVRTLEDLGTDLVFGIPGGAVLPLYDALHHSTKLRHVLTRHEQGAGHAAEGYAQASGKPGGGRRSRRPHRGDGKGSGARVGPGGQGSH